MIEIGGNVKIGGQIIIGDVFAVPTFFTTDTNLPQLVFLVTEGGIQLAVQSP
jgi:hypothetical protein